MKRTGKFITLDGIDGAGKGTQLWLMQRWFRLKKMDDVLFTREPGGTPIGEAIRNLLLDPTSEISTETETLLLFAARQQHLQTVILPTIQQGRWVVCDRFTEATYAYQGRGKGLAWEKIKQLEVWVQKKFQPDLSIFLDVSAKVSLLRRKEKVEDRFEQEDLLFFERVRSGYLARVNIDPTHYHRVDANQPIEVVQKEIIQLLEQLDVQSES